MDRYDWVKRNVARGRQRFPNAPHRGPRGGVSMLRRHVYNYLYGKQISHALKLFRHTDTT